MPAAFIYSAGTKNVTTVDISMLPTHATSDGVAGYPSRQSDTPNAKAVDLAPESPEAQSLPSRPASEDEQCAVPRYGAESLFCSCGKAVPVLKLCVGDESRTPEAPRRASGCHLCRHQHVIVVLLRPRLPSNTSSPGSRKGVVAPPDPILIRPCRGQDPDSNLNCRGGQTGAAILASPRTPQYPIETFLHSRYNLGTRQSSHF